MLLELLLLCCYLFCLFCDLGLELGELGLQSYYGVMQIFILLFV